MIKPLALNVIFTADKMSVSLVDGRTIDVPLTLFPRLLNAQPNQRSKYSISGGGTGLHWDELDEDISVEHLLLGYGDRTARPLTTP